MRGRVRTRTVALILLLKWFSDFCSSTAGRAPPDESSFSWTLTLPELILKKSLPVWGPKVCVLGSLMRTKCHRQTEQDEEQHRSPRSLTSLLRTAAKWVGGQISAATPRWVLGQSHRTSSVEWKRSLPLKCADNSGNQATDEGQDISAQLMFSICWWNSHWKCRHWQSLLSSWFLGTGLRILNLKMS